MANTDSPKGLQYKYKIGGGCPTVRACYAPSTYATALYIGDPVIITGTSNTSVVQNHKVGTLAEVNKASAAGGAASVYGVIIGFQPVTDETTVYGAASTDRVVYVIVDPDAVYEIQGDSATASAATDVGSNADLVYTHGGSTATGYSGAELDVSTVNTTATLQLKILGFSPDENNDVTLVNAKYLVTVNTSAVAPATAGV